MAGLLVFQIAWADSANEAGEACDCSERAAEVADLLPAMNGAAADFAERRSGAAADARIRIAVDHPAIYRITAADLVAKGVPLSDLVGASLRLFNRDREIPIEVSTSGAFGPADFVRFYGEGIDAYYTYDNAYWLGTQAIPGASPPLRWSAVPGSLITLAGTPTVTSACRQFRRNDHLRVARNMELDWSLALIANSTLLGVFQTFNSAIPGLGTVDPAGPAELEITFRQRTTIGDSAFTVVVENGAGVPLVNTTINDTDTSRPDTVTFTTAIQPSLIDTQLVIDAGEGDLYELDQFTLRYQRVLEPGNPVDGTLGFGGLPGAANYTISSTGPGGTLLNISNPSAPVAVQGAAFAGSYSFGHMASTNAPCFFYSEQDETVLVTDITVSECANLADLRRQADWIVIVPEAWLGSQGVVNLIRHRAGYSNASLPAASPLNVLAVTVESIYDEFGYGVKDAAAIKQFLGYAHHHFQAPAPRYVLLGGDASYDARNDIEPETDWIPTWLDPAVSFSETDSWYAQVAGGDELADFAIGRWPVQSAAEFDVVATKTIAAEMQAAQAFRQQVMLVHDEPPQRGGVIVTNFTDCFNDYGALGMQCIDFGAHSQMTAANVPAPYSVGLQSLASGGGNVSQINQNIRQAFNAGHGFIDFFGQTSKGKWGLRNYAEAMFDSADADVVMSSRYPLVNTYGSLTGQFVTDWESGGRSANTRLLINPNGGAAGIMANTWLLDGQVAEVLQASFYANLQQGVGQRYGDLWVAQSRDAAAAAGGFISAPVDFFATGDDSFAQWTLFADPALILP